MIDLLSGSGVITNPAASDIRIYYCPGDYLSWTQCNTERKFIYTIWLDRSSYPGKRGCSGTTDEGKKLCKILGF
jgi:hypothetical protein